MKHLFGFVVLLFLAQASLAQLAREGTRFTSFYAQAVCGPSRSALLTGRYPARSQGWSMPADEITFAELFKTVGYQTACIGKWDVSNRKAIIERMPNAQGFEHYFGPLRAGKGSAYEGGSRVPCIVRWPGKVPAGRVSDALFATIDLLPTFGYLAGFEVPQDRIIDGVNQADLLLGKSETDYNDANTIYSFGYH